MSINKGQLIELIENLPTSAHITTYYYLKNLTKRNDVFDEIDFEDYSFIMDQKKKEDSFWVDAFMEYHLNS
ncbi:hypothetical protein NST62_08460 [Ureibacillus sp. FSL K6-8385]|uniref:Uncharacterized protein n=1 Tax=Ureibacillus terrenus TaxID=118246 RepID=A0A540V1K4_9BACL|nr:hypothetical protein [Ureibacillus terrenus]MED3661989.1 hypothetical protein [Ureibacillus terrenus]MED3764748.1 hypothetical protein [Ureibacillus terrenus]TQE90616.1 hypothetical protein FKZ59_08910 [Ureibacillus terrenus]